MPDHSHGFRLRQLNAPDALEASFLAYRREVLRFLRARGAGEAAEDLLQDLWLRLNGAGAVVVGAPLPYMLRAANRLMIDRYRSEVQAARREGEWQSLQTDDSGASPAPSVERAFTARETLNAVEQALDSLGERAARVFRRHRIDDVPQRRIAEELGVSLSTVEADLRRAYRALAELRERDLEV